MWDDTPTDDLADLPPLVQDPGERRNAIAGLHLNNGWGQGIARRMEALVQARAQLTREFRRDAEQDRLARQPVVPDTDFWHLHDAVRGTSPEERERTPEQFDPESFLPDLTTTDDMNM